MKASTMSSHKSDVIVGCFAFAIVLGLIYNGIACLSIDQKEKSAVTCCVEAA